MPCKESKGEPSRRGTAGRTLLALTAALMLSACSETAQNLESALGNTSSSSVKPPESDLDKAAKAFAENPRNPDAALAYAEILKTNNRKPEALTVLQTASQANNGDRRILSAYGRLALDQGKLSLAKGLLEAADDPTNPDWRVVSARGTVLAKEGKHAESIPFFERARPLSNDHASVVNNLALAYMMSGEPAKAEPLLRQAAAADPSNVKVRQNLALVLSLQGRFDEAKKLAAQDLSPEAAEANSELMRKIVQVQQKPDRTKKAAVAAAESDWATGEEKPAAKPKPAPARAVKPSPADNGLRGSSVETSSTD